MKHNKKNIKWLALSAAAVLVAAGVVVWFCLPEKEAPEEPEVESELAVYSQPELYISREKIDISSYTAVNPDVKGIIRIPEAGLDEVVLQSSNGLRDYYLDKDWKGNYKKQGSVYFCNSFSLTNPAHKIWVLFGHNNADGSGFPALHKWNPDKVGQEQALVFYEKHHIAQLDTVEEGADWQIFGLFVHAVNHEADGEYFMYFRDFNFETAEEYQTYIDNIKIRSLIVTPVEVTTDDTIAILSTCITNGYNYYSNRYKDWRLIMALRRVPKGEDPEFDASSAFVNPNPLMPDIWHKNTGKAKPE